MKADLGVVIPAAIPRPDYLEPIVDPDFGGMISRVTNDTGVPMPIVGGAWALDSRHHYSKDGAWSDDGRLAKLQQKGGDPSNFVVSADTWQPLFSDRGSDPASKLLRSSHETRWRPGCPTQMVSTIEHSGGIDVVIWDVLSGAVIWRATIPSADPSFGWIGEGQISDDGRWTVFTTSAANFASVPDYIVVVDLERGKVGPRCDVSYATRAFPPASSGQGHIGNAGVSCLGNYARVKISGTYQYGFVLDIDKDSLIATRHPMQADALRMGPVDAQTAKGAALGTIAWLSHGDENLSSAGREVIVGGLRGLDMSNGAKDASKALGNVAMIDLATGVATHVSPGSDHLGGVKAASMQHGSGRAHRRRGWHLCSFEMGGTGWGAGEIMWVRLLIGAREVERLCAHRSMETGVYRAEAHPVASPDGSQVMFASNWMGKGATGGVGLTDNKAYVVTQSGGIIDPPPPPPVLERYYVDPDWTYQPNGAVLDRTTGRLVPLVDLARCMNERKA